MVARAFLKARPTGSQNGWHFILDRTGSAGDRPLGNIPSALPVAENALKPLRSLCFCFRIAAPLE